jgi:CheY-like chemotaxis protein/DNA-binding HxlR family transcriptional regulator
MRLLVVDDDAAFRAELSGLLEDGGHTVTNVASAAQAMTALEGNEFDVMFTDIRVGRQSGMDLLVDTRTRWPRLSVVMLTGKATVETAVQALQSGAFDYLRKPVSPAQVIRVLELVGQQLALTGIGAPLRDPVDYARALAAEGGYEVLLISPPPVPVVPPRVTHLDLEPEDPSRIRDAVEVFATPRPRAAVVIAAAEQLLEHHREEDIASLLQSIRALLEGRGPLAVGYDPSKITATGALAVRASIVSADANTTIESLSNPIRRLVLRRLAEGPCTFTQAMAAAHLDDTSKIAFHLRKLTDSGLVEHPAGEEYRLTARGTGAIRILNGIDDLDSDLGSGNRVFPWQPPSGPSKSTTARTLGGGS